MIGSARIDASGRENMKLSDLVVERKKIESSGGGAVFFEGNAKPFVCFLAFVQRKWGGSWLPGDTATRRRRGQMRSG